jgi:phosphate:Na+ symporter
MRSLEEGFKTFTGGTLEQLLRRSTDRLWKSLGFGLVTTTLMQSSSLVSLVTIAFVSSQMVTLAGGIGIIMGANLGTTTGAWLIAGLGLRVDIAAYAMPFVVFGVVLLFQRAAHLKGIGYLCLGIGFLFLGIHYIKEGFDAVSGDLDLAVFAMPGVVGVLFYTALGLIATVITQSSHATLLLVITALAAGQIGYENALAVTIGANLGSTATALLGGMTASLGGKRLAIAHLVFNVMTAVVAIGLIVPMVWAVEAISSAIGIAADDYMLQLAVFHTLFNLIGVVLLAPFVKQLEQQLIRHVRVIRSDAQTPQYLYPEALGTPDTAVSAVRKEVGRLYENAYGLLAHGLSLRRAVIDSDQSLSEAVAHTRRIMPLDVEDLYEARVKSLHSSIVAFISEAQRHELSEAAINELYALRQASQDVVESVKAMKHLHKNLAHYGLSADPAIRRRYDAMRLQLARLLREIRQMQLEPPEDVTGLSLDSLKVELEKSSRHLMNDIDEGIRQRQISPEVATSMMNDEGYVHAIGKRLLRAARTLVLPRAVSEQVVEEQLSLDDEAIAALADDAGAMKEAEK